MVNSFSTKGTRQFNGKSSLSDNSTQKTGTRAKCQDHMQKDDIGPLPHNTHKNRLRVDQRSYTYVSAKAIKFLNA